MKEVSKVAIFHKGKLLMGVRQDSGKWTEPGGGLHRGEDPLKGAIREVREETGINLSPKELTPLGSKEVVSNKGEKLLVHAFRAELEKEPRTSVEKDPDKEVFGWDLIPLEGHNLPKTIEKNLHVPSNKNILHFFLGFNKKASMKKIVRIIPSERIVALMRNKNGDKKNEKRDRK